MDPERMTGAKPRAVPSVVVDPNSLSRRLLLKRGLIVGGSLTVVPAVLAACGGSGSTTSTGGGSSTAPKSLESFQFSYAIPAEDSENTAYMVNKKIYGPEEGIDFEVSSGTTTSDFVKEVVSGHFNAAHPSAFLMALLKDQGLPVKIYFDNMDINIFGFAVKQDSPIKTMKDFEGKNIGIAVVGWDAIWNPNLAAAGVDPSTVKYTVVGLGPARLNALQEGKIDAMVTWNGEFPLWDFESKANGDGPLRFFSGEKYFKAPANGWAADEDSLKTDRELLVKGARAQAKAMWFVKTNPEESAKIFHSYYPDVQTRPGEAEAIATDYNNTGFTPGPQGTMENGLGYSDEERWQELLDSMYENELTKKHLKASELVTNELIEEINDFDKDKVIEEAQSYTFKS